MLNYYSEESGNHYTAAQIQTKVILPHLTLEIGILVVPWLRLYLHLRQLILMILKFFCNFLLCHGIDLRQMEYHHTGRFYKMEA